MDAPKRKKWYLIDYIIVRARNIKNVLRCRELRSSNSESDHLLVRATVRVAARFTTKKKSKNNVYDTKPLKRRDIATTFQQHLDPTIAEGDNVETLWNKMKQTYLATCEKLLPKKKAKQWDWFDESDQDLKKVIKRKKDA